MKIEKLKSKTKLAGFSFIEVMLSVLIVTAGLIISIQLVSKSLSQTIDSRNQVIASELAQEGIELMRNFRDNNWAQGKASFANFPNFNPNGSWAGGGYTSCGIDINNLPTQSNESFFCYYPSLNSNAPIRLYLSGNYYSIGPNKQTPFQRSIIFQNYDGTNLTIICQVIWGSSWPAISSCNASTKCAYSQVTLSKWGGT